MFDVLVIGGGIQGAGVAHAAAAAGYQVLLVEKKGLATGTSSRSSKLIHGGLRYLESAQFGLVRECLQERQRLLQRAPDLVKLTPHYIPVYPGTRRRPWQIRLGLCLYALLGGMSQDVRFSTLGQDEFVGLDGLQTHQLQTVFRYYDGQTDDAALTHAVAAAAQRLGVKLAMPATFTRAEWRQDHWQVKLQGDVGEQTVQAHTIVNAAGPWVNEILPSVTPAIPAQPVELVAGTHVIFEGSVNGVYYVEAPRDGRAVFVMPWQEQQVLVGTTERIYQGDPALIEPAAEEVDYLCDTLGHYFPHFRGVKPVSAFAGLRVLPADTGSPFSRARDTRLQLAKDGRWVSLYGGKLTAYRATAEKVVDTLKKVLPSKDPIADTKLDPLLPV